VVGGVTISTRVSGATTGFSVKTTTARATAIKVVAAATQPPIPNRDREGAALHRKAEVVLQIKRGLEPPLRVFRQASSDQPVQRRRCLQRLRFPIHDRRNHTRACRARKSLSPAEQFVQHAAEGKDVTARVRFLAL